MKALARFIVYGGPFGNLDFPMTTRWHRLKCTVRFRYYHIRRRVLDFLSEETYVPLYCMSRHELRSWASSTVEYDGGYYVDDLCYKNRIHLRLPPDFDTLAKVPTFTTPDACSAYVHKTWPHLAP